MGNIKFVLLLLLALQCVCWCACQTSTMDFDVVEINRDGTATLACNVSSAGNLTRWTYLSGSTETILMSFQNGLCTVSPSNSFLSDSRFSYTCNSTVYQVTILPYDGGLSINNDIIACRDALQPDGTGSTWIIKIRTDNTTDCSYCQPTMTFNVLEVTEGNNLTFVCIVSSEVAFTNWNLNFGSWTETIGVLDDQCATSSNATTFLDNTNEYMYTCNNTVYQVTRLSVQRREHNDTYMCTPAFGVEGTGSNWIINVKAPVSSVDMTPSNYLINVTENTTQRFTCTTSTARPAASVYWYIHPNENNNDVTQITENITTTTDYNDLSVTTSVLTFFPTRRYNNMKIFCEANNSLNTNQVSSDKKRLLNVLYKADGPHISVSNEYRVIEDTQGTLSCSAKGGNPTPTLSWSCNNFSPANQPTISSDGNVTSTLTWTALRNHDGTCRCTSQQTGFQDEKVDISVVVLYPPSKPELKVNGSNVVGDIQFLEGKTRSIKCTADSKPSPDRYTWTGPAIVNPINSDTLIVNEIKKTDAGQYTCSVHNTMKLSSGGSVVGINNNSVNVVVLYKADDPYINVSNGYRVIEDTQGTLSCSVKGGNPTPTLSWSCNNFSPANQPTISSNGNVTSTLTWTALRNHDGTCTCKSQQTGFQDEKIDISLVVLYPPSKPEFSVNGSNVTGDIKLLEGTTKSIKCKADSKPSPDRYTWTGPAILNPINSDTLIVNEIKKTDAGQYTCSVHNTMQTSSGGSVAGINNNSVNVVVLYLTILQGSNYRIIENEIGLLSCSANSGHQTATLKWNCTNISGVESTISSGEIITNTLTWTTTRGQDGTCLCTSKQTGFPTSVAEVHVTILHSPDYPTHFQYFDDLSTSSSIQLAWNPGYNGGSQQTFYIKYKAINLSSWKYKTVPDNGKQTLIFTLTGLNANTFYQIIVLSTNMQGNSTESQPLLAHTTELEQEDSPNLGPMIGGFAGGSIVFGVIMLIVGILIGRKVSRSGFSKKTSSSLKQSDAGMSTISSNTVAQYDDIGRENEYEMITKCNSPSMFYTPLQPGNNLTQNESRSDDTYENAI